MLGSVLEGACGGTIVRLTEEESLYLTDEERVRLEEELGYGVMECPKEMLKEWHDREVLMKRLEESLMEN